jgi:hypothetical protein
MEKLVKLFNYYALEKQSLTMEIGYNKISDWVISIEHEQSCTIIFNENGGSLELLCAKAFVALAEWGREFEDLEDIILNKF